MVVPVDLDHVLETTLEANLNSTPTGAPSTASLGIAGVATIVSHDTVQAHAVLAEHVTKTDPASMARVAMLAHAFIGRGADPGTATARAYAVLDRQMFGQASVIAYGHTYIIAAMLVLALIPLLALVRQTKSANAAEMMLE